MGTCSMKSKEFLNKLKISFKEKKNIFHSSVAVQKSRANQKEKLTWLCKMRTIPQKQHPRNLNQTQNKTPAEIQTTTKQAKCKR